MGNYEELMRKIRERPALYLGKKSLTLLVQFLNGYELGVDVGVWETSTGLDFFENYDVAMQSIFENPQKRDSEIKFHQFNEFVHTYYNRMINLGGTSMPGTSMSSAHLISETNNSDEEAFDKYFELLEAFRDMTMT